MILVKVSYDIDIMVSSASILHWIESRLETLEISRDDGCHDASTRASLSIEFYDGIALGVLHLHRGLHRVAGQLHKWTKVSYDAYMDMIV